MTTVAVVTTDGVVGAIRPTPTITWYQADGTIQDLTGVTSLSGFMRSHRSQQTRAIAGALAVSDAAAGQFTWTRVAADVAEAGVFDVQIVAVYGSPPTPAKTYMFEWTITEALSAS